MPACAGEKVVQGLVCAALFLPQSSRSASRTPLSLLTQTPSGPLAAWKEMALGRKHSKHKCHRPNPARTETLLPCTSPSPGPPSSTPLPGQHQEPPCRAGRRGEGVLLQPGSRRGFLALILLVSAPGGHASFAQQQPGPRRRRSAQPSGAEPAPGGFCSPG